MSIEHGVFKISVRPSSYGFLDNLYRVSEAECVFCSFLFLQCLRGLTRPAVVAMRACAMTRAMPLVIAAVKEDLVEENEKVSSFPLNYLLKVAYYSFIRVQEVYTINEQI